MECIDAIRAALTRDEFIGWCKGSAIERVWHERGGNGSDDLREAAARIEAATEAVAEAESEYQEGTE